MAGIVLLCQSLPLFICRYFPLSPPSLPPSRSLLLVWQQTNTVVILQTIFIRSSHPLRRTSLSSHNPSWHHQNPFLYCEEGMGISAQECVNVCVCVCVCPSPLSLPLFSHWVCASSLCLLADRTEGETIVLHVPRDPPLPSLGWNPFYSANSSQSGISQQNTHHYCSGWEGDTML